jgi:4-hydroxy-3-methylbut-2-enyl diphosphate reductase
MSQPEQEAEKYDSPEQRYSYQSDLIDNIRSASYEFSCGRVTLRIARKFGFCWGVDRAVAMVWDAIRDNPGRPVWLLNQIIHNPQVNEDFLKAGVRFVFGRYAEQEGFDQIRSEDVVVIPAFSAEVQHLQQLRDIGCRITDTTCPWVEKPHRRVLKYLEDGFTTIIHGLRGHDETRATCSLVDSHQGHYLVVRDLDETRGLCSHLRGESSAQEFLRRFQGALSEGFDPHQHLQTVGLVNQTTMLASESREVARLVAEAMRERDAESTASTFRDFDTICPATQDNQDAVIGLTQEKIPDVFLVLGGYDSSNTRNLLRAARARSGAYHIQTPSSIAARTIHHRDPQTGTEVCAEDWLPDGKVLICLSAGASTPDTELAEVVHQVCKASGVTVPA